MVSTDQLEAQLIMPSAITQNIGVAVAGTTKVQSNPHAGDSTESTRLPVTVSQAGQQEAGRLQATNRVGRERTPQAPKRVEGAFEPQSSRSVSNRRNRDNEKAGDTPQHGKQDNSDRLDVVA